MFLLFALLATAVMPPSVMAGSWSLTDGQLHTSAADVQSVDAAGVHLAATRPSVVKWDDVQSISQPVAVPPTPAGALAVYLTGGDHLLGAPTASTADDLKWNSPLLGDVSLPLDRVTGISTSGSRPADLDATRTDDVVRLTNGDMTHGIVNAVAAGGVTLQSGDATPTLPWSSVSAVLFSTPNPPALKTRAFRVTLADDESLIVSAVSIGGEQADLQLDAHHRVSLPVSDIARVEQLNGPVSWLTDLRPTENVYRPFFSENFPTRFDQTVEGRPITAKYPDFHHGIGCHSYAKLTYPLDGQYAAFRTQFAIDDDSPLADVTVRILLDGKVAFERKNVRAGEPSMPIVVPLQGARTLGLEVDYGENYATEDRFVWLDPALIRTLAQPTTDPNEQGG